MGLGVAGRRSEGGSERRNVSASDRSQWDEREYYRQNLVHGIVPSAKMAVGGKMRTRRISFQKMNGKLIVSG